MEIKKGTARVPQPVIHSLCLTAGIWAVCLSVFAYWRLIKNLREEYTRFYLNNNFLDFLVFADRFKSIHAASFFDPSKGIPWEYPAPAALVYSLYYNLIRWQPLKVFQATMCIGVVVLFTILAWALIRIGTSVWGAVAIASIGLFLMYPFWFEWEQANIEVFLFLLLSCGLLALLRGKFALAAVLIGLCASMKVYPFVFLALYLPIKRYKELALAAVTVVVASVASYWLLCPQLGVAWEGVHHGLEISRETYMLAYRYRDTSYDHAILGFIKLALYKFTGQVELHPALLSGYSLATAVTGLALYFGRIRKLPLLNQITCLYLCQLVLTPESFEYTLMHLAFPWALLVVYAVQRAKAGYEVQHLKAAFVCFAILFAPENFLVSHQVVYGGQLKCIVLVVLLWIASKEPWKDIRGCEWFSSSLNKLTIYEDAIPAVEASA